MHNVALVRLEQRIDFVRCALEPVQRSELDFPAQESVICRHHAIHCDFSIARTATKHPNAVTAITTQATAP